MTIDAQGDRQTRMPARTTVESLQSAADSRAAAILRSLSSRLRGPRDGEQRKTLAKIYQAILAAQQLETNGTLGEPQRSTVVRLLEVDATKLGLDALLALMDVWDRTLIEACDPMYIRGLLRVEIGRSRRDQPTSVVTLEDTIPGSTAQWSQAMANGSRFEPGECERGANQLFELYRRRAASYQLQRARDKLSTDLLRLASAIVFALVVSLIVALVAANPIAIAATAGALGACISSTMHLRMMPRQLGTLRAYQPLAALQPLIGAAAGLFVYMLLSASAANMLNTQMFGPDNSWAVTGLVAFVAGFSEPRFIGVVDRLADVVLDEHGEGKATVELKPMGTTAEPNKAETVPSGVVGT